VTSQAVVCAVVINTASNHCCNYLLWEPKQILTGISVYNTSLSEVMDRLCGLVARVLGYRSGSPGSIPGTNRKKKLWVWNGVHSASLSTTEELLDRKVAAPV
jgi:hypothetical protein